MKNLLSILACLFLALPAHAQVYKEFPEINAKKIDPTQQQIDEAFAVNDQCKAADTVRNFYDCECLAATFLDLRTRNTESSQSALIIQARKKCPNTTAIAGFSYERCLSWATSARDDYERYCTCYANTFAKTFAQKPNDSIRGREIQMTQALNQCSTGTEVLEYQGRQRDLELLKRQGVYNKLFPGTAAP